MSIAESHTKRPFQITRSPLVFWLGLFGLIFILWSWVDSMTRIAGIGRLLEIRELHPPKRSSPPYTLYTAFYGHAGGCLKASIPIGSSTAALRVEAIKLETWTSHHVPDAEWFPVPAIQREKPRQFTSGASYVGTTFLFPHWNLLVIYLSIWAGVMDWSSRRARRAALKWQQIAP